MPAVAVTDHGNMFGAMEFYTKCRSAGIKPIIGSEVYLAPGCRLAKETGNNPEAGSNYHLILLCENLQGYRNLCRLVSIGYKEGFYRRPRIDKAVLAEHSEGLIALSACLKGELACICAARTGWRRRLPRRRDFAGSSPAATTSSCRRTPSRNRPWPTTGSWRWLASLTCRWWRPTTATI